MKDYIIREMQTEDANFVLDIFQQGIETKNATFDTKAPTWEEWDASFFKNCRLVLVDDSKVLAWAALKPISSRECFCGVAEVSIYMDMQIIGKGLGKLLLGKLILSSEEFGFWTLQSGIFPENKASLNLHFQCGFREVGFREKIGQMHGEWRDIVLLERRSELFK